MTADEDSKSRHLFFLIFCGATRSTHVAGYLDAKVVQLSILLVPDVLRARVITGHLKKQRLLGLLHLEETLDDHLELAHRQ